MPAVAKSAAGIFLKEIQMNVSDYLNSAVNWQFLNEPLYRWWLFFLAIALSLFAWHGVLEFMK